MADEQQVTRREFDEVISALNARIDGLESEQRRLRDEVDSIKRELKAKLRPIQNRHQVNQMRLSASDRQVFGLSERLHLLEELVMDIDLGRSTLARRN